VRAAKAEDEVAELVAKSRQLETELDLTAERLSIVSLQLEEKEKSLMAAEAEMNALGRRVSGLEEDLEKTEEKLTQANTKLDKAGTAADDSERAKKVFENKAGDDDKRISALEKELKEARDKAEAADTAYDDVAKKLATCDSDLEKAEEGRYTHTVVLGFNQFETFQIWIDGESERVLHPPFPKAPSGCAVHGPSDDSEARGNDWIIDGRVVQQSLEAG